MMGERAELEGRSFLIHLAEILETLEGAGIHKVTLDELAA
jgi:hypothetical protein